MLGGNHQGTALDNYHLPFFFKPTLCFEKNFPNLFPSYSFSKSQPFASEPGEKNRQKTLAEIPS